MMVLISSKKVFRTISIIIKGLVLIHIVFQLVRFFTGHDEVFGLAPLFNVDREFNIPALFSTLLLISAAILFWVIAKCARDKQMKFFWQWHLLGWAFAWLGVDEFFSIHEKWSAIFRKTFHTSGFFYYTWQLPYLIILLVLAVCYIPFIKHLTRRILVQMTLAAVIYLMGVVVLEGLQGWYTSIYSDETSYTYFILTTVEETCEMFGIGILIYALLNQLVIMGGFKTIKFVEK